MRNKKIILILITAMVLVIGPMLSVDANVQYTKEALSIDFSDAYVNGGNFYLPLDEVAIHNMFRMVSYPGYVDEKSKEFIALGTRHLSQDEWFSKFVAKIPLNTTQKLVMINNIFFFSYGNDFAPEFFRVPAEVNGKQVLIDVTFNGNIGKVDLVSDEADNEITLKQGDVIKPIYKRFKSNSKIENISFEDKVTEDIVMQDKKIVYNGRLLVTQNNYTADNYAFRVFAQTNGTEGHAYSEVVVPKTFKSAAPANNPSSSLATASEWAKSEIALAAGRDLTTERVMKDFQKPITREEFCELVVKLYEKLSGKTAEPISPNPFKDTDNIAVLKAYKLGIVNGTSADQFSPDKLLNREQMAKMFYYTLKLTNPNLENVTDQLRFSDNDEISNWAVQPIKFMFKEGIIQGSNNRFNPQQQASREQAIVLVFRVFSRFD